MFFSTCERKADCPEIKTMSLTGASICFLRQTLFTLDSKMAEEGLNSILVDLQKHLQNAKIPHGQLSVIAQKGDEAVRVLSTLKNL